MVSASRFAAVGLLLAMCGAVAAQRSPDDALRELKEGNRRFAADQSVPQPLGEGVRRTLARGQTPLAIVLCCADSRVPPEHVFNAGLGELFVVRVAGHTCDPETLASIEYAVEHLNVPLCVVLGHEKCGAVAAAVAQFQTRGNNAHDDASPAIRQLLEQIEPAVRRASARDFVGDQLCAAAEEENVHHTVNECLRRSDLLRRYASVGRFRMVGARYHLQSGEVEWLPMRPMPAEPTAQAEPAHGIVPANAPPHVALRMLQAGHRRFLGDGHATGDISSRRREALTHGQQPLAIVLTCADSRVAPEHVFDAGLGELFVIRVAGNTLNDDVLASIEYAATHTGASLLVVMGHSRCGAIQAASEHPEEQDLSPNLRALLARLEPSVAKAEADGPKGADLVTRAVRGNVLRTVAETRSRSAVVRQLEAEGRFAVLPAVYDLATGDVAWLKDTIEDVTPAATPAGETSTGHGSSNGHGEHHTTGTKATRAKAHAEPEADDGHGAATEPAHGAAHGSHDANDAHDAHEGAADEHDDHAPHGDAEHGDGEHDDHATNDGEASLLGRLFDPRMLLAGFGVVSLGVAMWLTRKKAA